MQPVFAENHPDPAPWLAPDRSHWDQSVRLWLHQAAQANNLGPILSLTDIKARPWSMVQRAVFQHGRAYFKACGPGGMHEVPLLRYLDRHWSDHVPPLLATDPARGWILTADSGQPLRDTAGTHLQIEALKQLLPKYAELQLATTASIDHFLRMELPDRRLHRLLALIEDLLAGDALTAWRTPAEQSQLKASVHRLLPALQQHCSVLEASPYAAAMDHGDLHTGNILAKENHLHVCDWGDACITHPFSSLGVTLQAIQKIVPGPSYAAIEHQWIESYLEPWSALASNVRLQSEMQIALWLSHPLRALDMAHMFGGTAHDSATQWKPLIGDVLHAWVHLPCPRPA